MDPIKTTAPDRALDALEASLRTFVSALDPEFPRLRRISPGLTRIVTEAAIGVFVIEYVLRKKGLVEPDDLMSAVVVAQNAVRRLRIDATDA